MVACNKRACFIALYSIVAVVGVGLIIISSLAVPIVNNVVENSLKSKIMIKQNFDGWSDSDINKWINTDVNYTYRAFNITNLANVLSTGEKPKLAEIGPWTVNEKSYKYNITWVGEYVQYMQWWNKGWVTPNDESEATTKPMISLNPAYIGLVSAIGAGSACNPPSVESTLYSVLSPAAIAGVAAEVLTPSKQFQAIVRGLCLGPWVQRIMTLAGLGAYGSLTPTDIVNKWISTNTDAPTASPTTGPTEAPTVSNEPVTDAPTAGPPTAAPTAQTNGPFPADEIFTAFWLNRTINADVGRSLFDASNAWAFTNSSSAGLWTLSYLLSAQLVGTAGNCAVFYGAGFNSTGALCNAFKTATNASSADYLAVISWIGDALNPARLHFTSVIDQVVAPSLAAGIGCTGATGLADIAYCQLGSSRVSLAMFSSRTVDTTASCASLSTRTGCKGFEFAAATQGAYSLTIAQAKALFSMNSTFVNYLASAASALKYAIATSNTGNRDIVYGGLAAALPAYGFDMANTSKTDAILDFVLRYLPVNYAFPKVVEANSGMFTRRPPAEIMFGYTPSWAPPNPANNDYLLAQVGQTYPGLLSNWTSQEVHFTTSLHGYYRLYTGDGDINYARKYLQWRNASFFQSAADIPSTRSKGCSCVYSPASRVPTYTSFPFPPTCNLPNAPCNITCPNIWQSPEYINGTGDGLSSIPFLYNDADRINDLPVFSSEAMRTLHLMYLKDVSVKGIRCRRYYLPESALANAANNSANAKYNMNDDPNGAVDLHWWFNNAPVILARPFFWNADSRLDLTFTQSNSMVDVISLSQYDDPEPYNTYIDIEPNTGLTMRGHKRLQYVLKLKNSQFDNPFYANVFNHTISGASDPTIYWPAFWADENGIIKDNDATDFKNGVVFGRIMAERLEFGGLAIGGFFLLLGFGGIVFNTLSQDPSLRKVESKAFV